jgi:hypothetical protein
VIARLSNAALALGEAVVCFFDTASFLALFLLAIIAGCAGKQFCHSQHLQHVQRLAGAVLLAYFVYRYTLICHDDPDQLLFATVRALLVAWLSYSVLLLIVPLVDGMRRLLLATASRSRRAALKFFHWCHARYLTWAETRRRSREIPPEPEVEPYRPPTYSEELTASVDQIYEQFEAEQAVVDLIGSDLDELEQQEIRDVPRQKLLQRLYRVLGGDDSD